MRANFDRLGPPPRALPASLGLALRIGGRFSVIGGAILLFLTPFVWLMGTHADVSSTWLFRGELLQAPGVVTAVKKTAASEGRSPISAVTASYTVDGRALSSRSYVRGFSRAVGEAVELEYPAGKPEVARIVGGRRDMFGPGALVVLLAALPCLGLILYGIRAGARDERLLREGHVAKARLVRSEETGSSVDRRPVMALTFTFRALDGSEHSFVQETSRPEDLTDDKQELVLYLPESPGEARAVDGLPAELVADESGALSVSASGLKVAVVLALLIAVSNVACGAIRLSQ